MITVLDLRDDKRYALTHVSTGKRLVARDGGGRDLTFLVPSGVCVENLHLRIVVDEHSRKAMGLRR